MPTPYPVAFEIFGLEIMWYAIFVTGGILIATMICYFRAPKHGINQDTFLNMVLISVPIGIIGARAYYVLFNWSSYAGDMFKILNFRGGGLAIHGGLIAGLGTACLLCLLWKVRPLNLLDLLVPAIALGQCIGRWGNYFNMEAYGAQVTNPVLQFFPFAVLITRESGSAWFMATFFYESLWNFLVFLFLLRGRRRSFRKTGDVFSFYLLLYGAGRLVIEDFRSDSLYAAGGVRISQLLSLCLCMAVLICFFIRRIRESKPMSPLALCLFLLVCAGAFPVFLDSLKLWSPVSDLLLHRFLMLASFSFCTIAAALVIYGKSTPEEVRYAVHTA